MAAVVAVSMFKDEADVCQGVVTHLLEEDVEAVLVADNGSTDGTRDLLADLARHYARQITIVDDPEVGYFQSPKMTALAHQAHEEFDAVWIVPFDADELWYAEDRLGITLRASEANCLGAQLWNHWQTALDVIDPDPFRAMVWMHNVINPLPKVAVRWREDLVIHQGNHAASYGDTPLAPVPLLMLRHFPYRGFEHFQRKVINGAAAYAATDLPETEGAHWRQYGELLTRHGPEALREVYDRWFHFLAPVNADMARNPAPYRRWPR